MSCGFGNNKQTGKRIKDLIKEWPVKGAAIGAGGGLIVFGLKGVGLATMGFGIGLPAVVVTAAGGALIGTGVQIYKDGKRFIRKKQKDKKSD